MHTLKHASARTMAHTQLHTACSHAQASWESLTPEMYGLFWTLTVHDIYVPTKTYEREMEKVGDPTVLDVGCWMLNVGPLCH